MSLLWIVVILAVVGVGIIAAMGHFAPLAEQVDDRPSLDLTFPLTAPELRSIAFERVARGYRRQSVDETQKHLADLVAAQTLTTRDIAEIRFDVATNGYWPSQVDWVLDELRAQCIDKDADRTSCEDIGDESAVNSALVESQSPTVPDIVS